MKIAIKRVQSQACLGIAEREQFGAKLKKHYLKPQTEVIDIKVNNCLLAGSPIPVTDEETTEQW